MSVTEATDILRGAESGQVSDAMEQLGLRRSVLFGLTALGLGKEPMVGPAYTVRQDWKPAGTDRRASLVRHGEVTRGLARRGQVIVIATGGITAVATWGENHSTRCRALGIAGMVTDGATRDAGRVAGVGVPVFCRAVSPVKSLWDLQTTALDQPVVIGDVPVVPGDLIFADESGVLVIPADAALSVATCAQNIQQAEQAYRARFA